MASVEYQAKRVVGSSLGSTRYWSRDQLIVTCISMLKISGPTDLANCENKEVVSVLKTILVKNQQSRGTHTRIWTCMYVVCQVNVGWG